jgi:hypothetical protein
VRKRNCHRSCFKGSEGAYRRRQHQFSVIMEGLESRQLLSGTHATLPLVLDGSSLTGTTSPIGLTPSQIRGAYGLGTYGSSPITFGSIQGDGSGQTIAIVDAYDDPNALSDLEAFDAQFDLPNPPSFQKLNQDGETTSLPGTDPSGPYSTSGTFSWEIEESLDIEWAHAMAPKANIDLFEASDNSDDNLLAAVQAAANTSGVDVVSMSWGDPDVTDETSFDSTFVTPADHLGGAATVGGTLMPGGITFLASTGDTGAGPNYPAESPNVVAVGGTTLTVSGDTYVSESTWSEGGGGISDQESQPFYQNGVVSQSTTQRTYPDVSADADPTTGVPVYDSWDFGSSTPWFDGTIGGTSLSTPLWAGITAVADQGQAVMGRPSLDGASQLLPILYTLPSNAFNDITTGSNGYPAGPGYDLATGLGTPVGATLIGDLTGDLIYVDGIATGSNNGTSWDNAYTSLQSALSAAQTVESSSPGTPIDIFVGQGTYTPGSSTTSTFQLINNVDILGGYAGTGASNPFAQSTSTYPTILSGNSVSYSVVTASGTNSTARLQGVTISGGTGASGHKGGGIYNSGGSPTITNCTITDNSATTGGGGMYNSDGSPTLINCTFNSNSSYSNGAGIYDTASSPVLLDCTFTSNVADGSGGAMYNSSSSPSLTNCTFTSNGAPSTGGAIYDSASSPTLINCVFNDNGTSGYGAAMDNSSSSSPVLTDCTFSGNSSMFGPAITNAGVSGGVDSPVFNSCIFSDNSAEYSGGAIDDGAYTSATFNDCDFTSNGVSGGFGQLGGGLYSSGTSTSASLTDCTFTSNSAATGGGIYNGASASLTLSGCMFSDNLARSAGGAVEDNGSAASISDCVFTANTAVTGGAIQNESVGGSGAFITNSSFEGNSASSNGGAITNESSSSETILNSAFVGDTATSKGGSVYNHSSSTSTLINDTITAGSAGTGGAIYGDGTSPSTVTNSILWNNTGNEVGQDTSSSDSTISYSDIDQSGYSGSGNIDASPLFVENPDPSVSNFGNLQLQSTSPCIDTGNNSILPTGDTADLAGDIRVWNGTVDIGAYEFGSVSATAIYVDSISTGLDNGTSWTNAYTTLQQALTADTTGRTILVGQGIYSPGADVTDSFQLIDNVAIYGGYAGVGYSNPWARNVSTYVTKLWGDGVNFHVVNASGTDATAILDGFTILGGAAVDGIGENGAGGGIFDANGSATINDCIITQNNAFVGGGMFDDGLSAPTVTNCTFTTNSSGSGDAVDNNLESSPIFVNCIFTDGSSSPYGSGVYESQSTSTYTNCTFTGCSGEDGGAVDISNAQVTFNNCSFTNNVALYGAAVYISVPVNKHTDASATMINCLFANNEAEFDAGALAVYRLSSVSLINDTFSKNTVTGYDGGGSGGAIDFDTTLESSAINCIFWADTASSAPEINGSSSIAVSYSDVDGGLSGTGNINENPLFVDATTGNFQVLSSSPVINAGNNSDLPSGDIFDLAGNDRIVGGTVDMGAYEFQG